MASRWSKSALTPICALVSSFLLFFVLSALLTQPQPRQAPSDGAPVSPVPTTIAPATQLVVITVKPGPKALDQAPAGVESVSIWQADMKSEIGQGQLMTGSWSYQQTDAKTFKVCLTLKHGWSVTKPKSTRKDPKDFNSPWCTDNPFDGQEPIDIVLGGRG